MNWLTSWYAERKRNRIQKQIKELHVERVGLIAFIEVSRRSGTRFPLADMKLAKTEEQLRQLQEELK